MAAKIPHLTRRTFVKRAGLLVSSLGVAGGVQSGLMDSIIRKAAKKWGGEALAAEPGAVHFCVEILFRAGFQHNALFPSNGHRTDARDPDLNFYSSQANVIPVTVGGRSVNFARYADNDGADALAQLPSVMSGRVGVATSEAVQQMDDQHTSNFYTRAPSGSAPCPANLHASIAPPADVQGIEWNNGIDTTNQRGMTRALNVVKNQNDFLALFKDLPMYFTQDELKLVVGEIDKGVVVNGRKGAIGLLDDVFLARNIAGSADVAQVSLAGRGQAQLSLADQLSTADIEGNFTNIGEVMGGGQLGLALASAAKAFAAGASTTFTISLDSDDWHGDTPMLDDMTSKQGMWNRYIGNHVAGFLKSIETLPDPFDPTKMIIDSFLLSISSEFSRTPLRQGGTDNGDGGAQSFCFIGSKVRTGTYGNVTGMGAVQGFDPATGALAATNSMIGSAAVWKTHGKLMGISDSTLSMYVPDAMGKAIPILVR